jgi:hypothetical protein
MRSPKVPKILLNDVALFPPDPLVYGTKPFAFRRIDHFQKSTRPSRCERN